MYRKYLEDEKTSIKLFWFIFVLYALVYITKNCYSAAMSAIVHEGVMTKTQTGLISSMFFLIYAPLQVIGGKLADKYNPEKIITVSLFFSSLINFAIFLNQNYIFMLCMWSLNAVAQFGIWPAVFKIVSSQLAKEHRAKSVYYISFASTAGLICAYAVAMFMKKWQYNFLFSTIVLMLLSIMTFLIYRRIDKKMVEYDMPIVENKEKSKAMVDGKDVFLKSGLYIMFPLVLIRTVIQNSQNVAPTMLMESYGSVSHVIGNFLTLFVMAMGIFGTLAGKKIYYRYLRNEVKGYIWGFVALLPALGLITFVGKIPTYPIVASLMLTSFISSATGLFNSFVSYRFAKYGKNGEAAGIINSAASLGFVVQNYGIAYIADNFGWVAVSWLWVALAAIALVLLCAIYRRWKRFISEE